MNKLVKFLINLKNDDARIVIDSDIVEKNSFKDSKCIWYIFLSNSVKILEKSAFENSEISAVLPIKVVEEKKDIKSKDENLILVTGEKEELNESFSIQNEAFKECENLHTVILPKKEKIIIESKAFCGCSSLKSFVFQESIDLDISPDAFYGIDGLSFYIPENNFPTEEIERFAREHDYKVVKYGKII